ncbi:MAG: class I SAM-dependent RNA methyltransferase [Pseudomonadota bacterium]
MFSHTIERLGAQGDGIAPGPVYVTRALPGELVEGAQDAGRIEAPRILQPSPDRVKPPCTHYKTCGGCVVQHASDGFVAGWKQDLVRQALAWDGVEAEVLPPLTSPAPARRRAAISARRTKAGALAGFHGRKSGTIVDVKRCEVLDPALAPAFDIARHLARTGASRSAELNVLATVSRDGLDIAVTGGKPLDASLQAELGQYCGQHGIARLAWNDEVIALRHPPRQRFGPAHVVPPPGAFLQATAHAQKVLQDAVLTAAEGSKSAVDLFAGCGTFSLPLAELMRVHAVEGDAGMTRALEAGWRGSPGLRPLTAEVRDLFRNPLLPDELKRYDVVVLDPPRAGATAQTAAIAQSIVPVVVYVSCNPTTFARDAAVLIAAGYSLGPVQPVDQFRWSPHVEVVARFHRP